MQYDLKPLRWGAGGEPLIAGKPAELYRIGGKQLMVKHEFKGLLIPTEEAVQPILEKALEEDLAKEGIPSHEPLAYHIESGANPGTTAHWRLTLSIWRARGQKPVAPDYSNL